MVTFFLFFFSLLTLKHANDDQKGIKKVNDTQSPTRPNWVFVVTRSTRHSKDDRIESIACPYCH